MASEGFLGRWARRKQEAAAAAPVPEAAEPAPPVVETAPGVDSASPPVAPTVTELPPVATLTPESDFRPFLQAGVDTPTRNAAMKALFTDPHFNVMDGLDIYIDDYSKPSPMSLAMLQSLQQARSLGLGPPEDPPPENPSTPVGRNTEDAPALSQSAAEESEAPASSDVPLPEGEAPFADTPPSDGSA